ncbi:hypothetical protein [Streptomyces sp. NPDC005141]
MTRPPHHVVHGLKPPEFREIWERYEVVGSRTKTKEFLNPYAAT